MVLLSNDYSGYSSSFAAIGALSNQPSISKSTEATSLVDTVMETCCSSESTEFCSVTHSSMKEVPFFMKPETIVSTTPSSSPCGVNYSPSPDCSPSTPSLNQATTRTTVNKRRTVKRDNHTRKFNKFSPVSPSEKKILIDKKQMERYYYYPQPTAAKLLGVSLSTLKRRYYEIVGHRRWPYPDMKRLLKKKTISYIVHDKDKPTKQLDPHTLHVLKKAFSQSIQHNSQRLDCSEE